MTWFWNVKNLQKSSIFANKLDKYAIFVPVLKDEND